MMKKMWKKNNKAVSPVIATILMVAITVVLAAVLYVMVMGMSGGDDTTTPTGVLGNPAVTTTTAKVTITSLTPDTPYADLDWRLSNGTAAHDVTITQAFGAIFTDVGGDLGASSGDYFTVTGLTVGTDVTFYLIYEPTGDVIDSAVIDM